MRLAILPRHIELDKEKNIFSSFFYLIVLLYNMWYIKEGVYYVIFISSK